MTIPRNLSFLAEGASSTGVLGVSNGGTGLTNLTSGYIPYGNGTSAFSSSANLQFNGTNLGIGGASNSYTGYTVTTINSNTNGSVLDFNINGTRTASIFATPSTGGLYVQTNVVSPIVFTPNSVEAVRIFASGGVSIGNTTDPGAGNLRFNTTGSNGIYFGSSSQLNDYETGTWTPSQGSGLTVLGTFSSAGTYTKIGRLVMVNFNLSATTSIAASSGAIIAGNFPYVPSTGSGLGFNGSTSNSNNTAYNGVFLYSTSMYIDGVLSATPSLNITITYNV